MTPNDALDSMDPLTADRHIVKEGDKWVLYSKDGKKKLGTFNTKEEALKHEQQVEYFKNKDKKSVRVMERRFLSLEGNPCRVEKRVGTDPPGVAIVGYAAPFYRAENPGTEYMLDDDLTERIMPGCFDRAVRECDVRALFNHNPDNILGRNIAGTLELSVDQVGLRYRISLPDTSFAQDVVTSVARGDVTGSSFSFLPYAEPDAVVMVHMADGRWVRELRSVELYDVGPVTFPAYKATTSGARMVGEIDPAVREELEQAKRAEAVKRKILDYVREVDEKLAYWRQRQT